MAGAIPGWAFQGNSGGGLLTLFTFAPVIGLLIILFMPKGSESKMKYVANVFAAIPLAAAVLIWSRFNIHSADIQFYEHHEWFAIGTFRVDYSMGIDGLSMAMIFLSGLVGFLSSFVHYKTIQVGERGYYALLLLLLTGMNGVFCALDFFLFFLFWEMMLLPMYFLIGVWGGPNRMYAAIKFFLYTMAGSVLILVGMLALWYYSDGGYFVPGTTGQLPADAVQEATAQAFAVERANAVNPADRLVYIRAGDATAFASTPFETLSETDDGVEHRWRVQYELAPANPQDPARRQVLVSRMQLPLNPPVGGAPTASATSGLAPATAQPLSIADLWRGDLSGWRFRIGELVRLGEAEQPNTQNADNPATSPLRLLYAASQAPDADGQIFSLQRTLNLMDLKARFRLFTGRFNLPIHGAISFANLMFLFFFIGFAIKVPVWPFHTWLPWAHVEAPTAISVILAGILLKMGIYGMLRMNYSLFPTAALSFAVPVGILGVINILYGAFCAMAQKDMKKLVAYSSVSHMGYCMLGLAAITSYSLSGCVMQMFNHGTATAMMFMLVGVVYDRAHHRRINGFGGIAKVMPRYTALMMLTLFASVGLPSLSGFISEAAVFLGSFMSPAGNVAGAHRLWGLTVSFQTLTIISALGVVVTAVYLLWMLQRVFFGPLNPEYGPGGHHALSDINGREIFQIAPLAFLCVFLGVYPAPLINLVQASCTALQNHVFAANGLAQYMTMH